MECCHHILCSKHLFINEKKKKVFLENVRLCSMQHPLRKLEILAPTWGIAPSPLGDLGILDNKHSALFRKCVCGAKRI